MGFLTSRFSGFASVRATPTAVPCCVSLPFFFPFSSQNLRRPPLHICWCFQAHSAGPHNARGRPNVPSSVLVCRPGQGSSPGTTEVNGVRFCPRFFFPYDPDDGEDLPAALPSHCLPRYCPPNVFSVKRWPIYCHLSPFVLKLLMSVECEASPKPPLLSLLILLCGSKLGVHLIQERSWSASPFPFSWVIRFLLGGFPNSRISGSLAFQVNSFNLVMVCQSTADFVSDQCISFI